MINVIDEQGNTYDATYAKRAKGLIKNGRARVMDENTICLACPPYKSEDNTVSENKSIYKEVYRDNDGNIITESVTEAAPIDQGDGEEKTEKEFTDGKKITIAEILKRIDYIVGETDYIGEALQNIRAIENSVDGSAGEKAQAMENIIKCRETTNQKVLALLERMYNDLMGIAETGVKGGISAEESYNLLKSTINSPHIGSDVKRMLIEKLVLKVF